MKSTFAVLFALLLWPGAALQAQGVYVTPGAQGPVFSDKPQPGAREVKLPPLTIVAPPPEPKATPTPAPAAAEPEVGAAAPAYRSFRVVSPEDNGSVMASTAIFEVRVAADPPLQLGAGHAYAVSINGRPVGVRFTANEFMIPPEYWGDTLPPLNQSLQLEASIVDGQGRMISKATPVHFRMRPVNDLNTPRGRPHPLPIRPSSPRAEPVPAIGATPTRSEPQR